MEIVKMCPMWKNNRTDLIDLVKDEAMHVTGPSKHPQFAIDLWTRISCGPQAEKLAWFWLSTTTKCETVAVDPLSLGDVKLTDFDF